MKYISIDLETTGVKPEIDQILSIGLVVEDTNNILPLEELPSLEIVIIRDRIEGNPFAIDMNKKLIRLLRDYSLCKSSEAKSELAEKNGVLFFDESVVCIVIRDFLIGAGLDPKKFNVAGKNFGSFDNLFLNKLPMWGSEVKPHQRVIDPATSFADWKNDENLPNLTACKDRAELDVLEVTHNAVDDAKDVIKVLRKLYV